MYSNRPVGVCLFLTACLHYCTYPDVTWGNGRGCPLAVHCWADLLWQHTHQMWQSARTLVLSLYGWLPKCCCCCSCQYVVILMQDLFEEGAQVPGLCRWCECWQEAVEGRHGSLVSVDQRLLRRQSGPRPVCCWCLSISPVFYVVHMTLIIQYSGLSIIVLTTSVMQM